MPDSKAEDAGGGDQPTQRVWRMPDTLLIMFTLALLAWAATFIFVPGQFEVAGDPARIVPGTYQAASATMPAPVIGNEERAVSSTSSTPDSLRVTAIRPRWA